MFKVLGYDDGVHICDCCGKQDLKGTFGVEMEDGEVLFYGSVCVTRNTGKPMKEIKSMAKQYEQERRNAASAEYIASGVLTVVNAKRDEARKLGLHGMAFRDYCKVESDAADAVRAELAAKYKVAAYMF
jgi:hypothetical protein